MHRTAHTHLTPLLVLSLRTPCHTHLAVNVRQRCTPYGHVQTVDTCKVVVVEVTVQALGRKLRTIVARDIGAVETRVVDCGVSIIIKEVVPIVSDTSCPVEAGKAAEKDPN